MKKSFLQLVYLPMDACDPPLPHQNFFGDLTVTVLHISNLRILK